MSTPLIYNPNKQSNADHNWTQADLPNVPSQLQEEKGEAKAKKEKKKKKRREGRQNSKAKHRLKQ